MNRRSVLAVGGGLLAALLAGVVAITVNLGIMRAVGSPSGPGNLGAMGPVAQAPRGSSRDDSSPGPPVAEASLVTPTAPDDGLPSGAPSAPGESAPPGAPRQSEPSDHPEHEFRAGNDD